MLAHLGLASRSRGEDYVGRVGGRSLGQRARLGLIAGHNVIVDGHDRVDDAGEHRREMVRAQHHLCGDGLA